MRGITVLYADASAGVAEGLAEGLAEAPPAGGHARRRVRRVMAGIRTFPDGESKITLDGAPSGSVVVVQSLSPPVDSSLVRALLMIAKARELSDDITAVVPYMGYARQDREFLPGEIVTARVVAKLLEAAGASRLVTVDIHSRAALDGFSIDARNVTAMPALAKHFAALDAGGDPLIVSPDAGGAGRAEEFARLYRRFVAESRGAGSAPDVRMGSDWIALQKRRDRDTGDISMSPVPQGIARGRDAIIVDDMISTGGSVAKAAGLLKRAGCADVSAACTHALLPGDARKRMAEAGVSRIVGTNTIPGLRDPVDVSGAILAGILPL